MRIEKDESLSGTVIMENERKDFFFFGMGSNGMLWVSSLQSSMCFEVCGLSFPIPV